MFFNFFWTSRNRFDAANLGEVPGVKWGDLERSVGHRGAEASGKVPRQGGGEGADGWLFSR